MFSKTFTRYASSNINHHGSLNVVSDFSIIKSSSKALLAQQRSSSPNKRQSFDTLINQLHRNYNLKLPDSLVEEVQRAFENLLKTSNSSDYQYYIQQLDQFDTISDSNIGWIYIQSIISQKKWPEILAKIKGSFISSQRVVPAVILTSFTKALLDENKLQLFFSFFEWTHYINYPTNIPSTIISEWVQKCIESKDPLIIDDILAKFFEKYILYTGPEEQIKKPVYEMNNDQIESLIQSFEITKNITQYSKSVAFYMDKLKSSRGNMHKYNDWRFKSRMFKFNAYTEKLGAYAVLENGMFDRFKLAYNKKIRIDKHMQSFIESLTLYMLESGISLAKCILLVELMHGIHIQRYKETFSKSLNPDIQMARIYRSVIKKTLDPDPLIIQNYNKIAEMNMDKKYTHMKDGIPQRRTVNQRFKNTSQDQLEFQSLPLHIMLRVLRNVVEKSPSSEYAKDNITISVIFFQAMIMKRNVRPCEGCFTELLHLALSHPETATQTPAIVTIHNRYHHQNNPSFTTLLAKLGLRADGTHV